MFSMSSSTPVLSLPPGFHQANVVAPKLSPEEEERRQRMLQSVRHFERKKLTHCETDDRSAPLIGARAENSLQAEIGRVRLNPSSGPRGGGRGRGRGGLGDLFAGGLMPSQGLLKGRGPAS